MVWTVVAWIVVGLAIVNHAYPDAVVLLWAVLVAPLCVIWYATRAGTSRTRIAIAVALLVVVWWGLASLRPALPA